MECFFGDFGGPGGSGRSSGLSFGDFGGPRGSRVVYFEAGIRSFSKIVPHKFRARDYEFQQNCTAQILGSFFGMSNWSTNFGAVLRDFSSSYFCTTHKKQLGAEIRDLRNVVSIKCRGPILGISEVVVSHTNFGAEIRYSGNCCTTQISWPILEISVTLVPHKCRVRY